jgi:hypothetical protein
MLGQSQALLINHQKQMLREGCTSRGLYLCDFRLSPHSFFPINPKNVLTTLFQRYVIYVISLWLEAVTHNCVK